jgi:hypothetical protein
MTDAERIEELEAKIQQAYQVIGVLLAGPDGECEDCCEEVVNGLALIKARDCALGHRDEVV